MLLAEDVLLLLTDDTTGRPQVNRTHLDLALAGAVLLDLALLRRVDVTAKGHPAGKGRVVVVDGTPTGDPVLDAALTRLAQHKPRRAQETLRPLGKDLRPALLDRLVRAGILRREDGTVLGVFPTTRWPAADVAHEAEVRTGIRDCVAAGRTPTDREAALVSLLQAVDRVPLVVGDVGLPKRDLRRRAKTIAQGEFAGEAVRRAIAELNAAVVGAVTAASVAATSAST